MTEAERQELDGLLDKACRVLWFMPWDQRLHVLEDRALFDQLRELESALIQARGSIYKDAQ